MGRGAWIRFLSGVNDDILHSYKLIARRLLRIVTGSCRRSEIS